MSCRRCDGLGEINPAPYTKLVICPDCGGTGEEMVEMVCEFCGLPGSECDCEGGFDPRHQVPRSQFKKRNR